MMDISFNTTTSRQLIKSITDFLNRPIYIDLSLYIDVDVGNETDHFRYSGRSINKGLRFSVKQWKLNGYKPKGIQFIGVNGQCEVYFVNKAADDVLRHETTNTDATILFDVSNWDNEENVYVIVKAKEVYLIVEPV